MKHLLLLFCVFVAPIATAQKAALPSLSIKPDAGNEKLDNPEGKLKYYRKTPKQILKRYD